MSSKSPDFELKLKNLPLSSGVYLFKNSQGRIIYIGKARNLRNRVRSYFQSGRAPDRKTERLVTRTHDFDLLLTDNEIESLILEANLVREHKPRYNVNLKDDKHFPYIKVTTREPFPRVLVVRRVENDGSAYFGPYTSTKSMRKTLAFLTRLFSIRTCSLIIPHPKGLRHEVCLDYHIKRCGGPCAGHQSEEEYGRLVQSLMMVLAGKSKELVASLTDRMQRASDDLRFEEARLLRDQIDALRQVMIKQKVDAGELVDRDILSIARESTDAIAVVLQIREGILIGRQDFHLTLDADEPDPDLLETFLAQYYNHQPNLPAELVLPGELPDPKLVEQWLRQSRGASVTIITPKQGQKAKLVDLAATNARLLLDELLIQKRTHSDRTSKMVTSLKDDLGLTRSPRLMVCFDISNTGENDAVGACVCFENGKPKKQQYRHFRIKGVQGQDDFKMMREVVGRHFYRLAKDKTAVPDLVVVDGGKGQLSSALAELTSLGFPDQPIISLAKRLEEVYLPGLEAPISISKSSPSLMLLKRIRDEAHRFAISYNRKVRTRRTVTTALDSIPGIGPVKRNLLLRQFGSVAKIRNTTPEDLVRIKGITAALAENILRHLSASALPAE